MTDPVTTDPAPAAPEPSEPRWLTDDQQQDWRSFYYAIVRLQEALDRDLLQGFGFPHGYYEIFVRLSEAPGRAMRMSELASTTRSSRSRLSHAVARLEESGWVERKSCETDRRGQIAHLTDAGLALLKRAAPAHLESVRNYLVDPLTDAQLRQLGEIGRIVYNSIPT
jgi:DNA-binding MarR family transcriptional regulator